MMLNWNEYIKKGLVKRTSPNNGEIKTLVETAENNIKIISRIKLNEESYMLIFKDFYDSLRSMCEAIALMKGYKIYSHEALGLFFKLILAEEAIFQKFNKFRIMRNNVQYYGKKIDYDESKVGIDEIKKMIDYLKKKYLLRLK